MLGLTPEEIKQARYEGQKNWASAMRSFWDNDNQPYPEHEEYYVRNAITKAQLDKALKTVVEGRLIMVISNRDDLSEVGDWAECQKEGTFVFFPGNDWQELSNPLERKE